MMEVSKVRNDGSEKGQGVHDGREYRMGDGGGIKDESEYNMGGR